MDSYKVIPHEDHSKIYCNGTHVGNMRMEFVPTYAATGPTKIDCQFHVSVPDGFKGNYKDRTCHTLEQAKRYAMTQHTMSKLGN